MALKLVKGRVFPIGVDLGTSAVKLAQLQDVEGSYELVAAAHVDVPGDQRESLESRLKYCGPAVRNLMGKAGFRGRQAVLSVPAAATFVQHVKVPQMPADRLAEAIRKEIQGKLPFAAEDAEIRHIVASELSGEGEARQEVIVVAVPRSTVLAHLAMARKARLDVRGLNIEPCAIVECFARLFRRNTDQKRAILFIDLGQASTQVVLSHGNRVVFARNLSVAGVDFDRAVAEGAEVSPEQAAELRSEAAANPDGESANTVHGCLTEVIKTLNDELTQCLRYYESVHRNHSIERVIFLGGQAADRRLCQSVAQSLNLPAQIGDPLVRIGTAQGGVLETGLDRRQPQPRWAVAVGLSLGAGEAA